MSRRYINQLTEGQTVSQIFLVGDKQVRANRAGNLYLQLRLTDRTGSVTGMLWNVNEKLTNKFEAGDYLTVEGTTQFYNGNMQLIITSIDNVDADFVREADFVQLTAEAVASLRNELESLLKSLTDPGLKALMNEFLDDKDFMDLFCRAPAGIKNHHAYHGGLLSHVVSMLKMADFIGNHYESISRDLLLCGTFLHDIGKTRELSFDRELSYTDEGQLIGHIQIGIEMLSEKAGSLKSRGAELPDEMVLRLKHMIASHHGNPEYGAIKVPMTLEAIALNHIDTLDSKLDSALDVINQDANDGNWTTYQPSSGRKFFKGDVTTSGEN